jgi:hypothetical protein
MGLDKDYNKANNTDVVFQIILALIPVIFMWIGALVY